MTRRELTDLRTALALCSPSQLVLTARQASELLEILEHAEDRAEQAEQRLALLRDGP